MKIILKDRVVMGVVLGVLAAGAFLTTSVSAATLSFIPSSVTLSAGQTPSVTITGGDGVYYVASSTNPGALQVTINGSTITFSTAASAGTSATVTICSALTANTCGTIVATVSDSGTTSSNTSGTTTAPTFSQSSLTMAPGTSQTISITGLGGYFISNNSNSAAASASLSGSSLSILALASGSSVITVCQNGGCGNVSVTVSASGSSGAFTFSESNPTVMVGEKKNITVSGGTNIYNLSNNSNPTALTATMSGATITLTGNTFGTAILTVCDSSNTCGTSTVTVKVATTATANTVTPTPAPIVNTSTNIPVSYAMTLMTQIQAMESQLLEFAKQLTALKASIQVLISGNFGATGTTSASAIGGKYLFVSALGFGDSGPEITALQNRLTAEGVYSGPVTGYYGNLTVEAVKKYQILHGLDPLGTVGPGTRAVLNR